jgi:hypothetical protein
MPSNPRMMIFCEYCFFGEDARQETTARATAQAMTTALIDFTGSLFVTRIGVSSKYSVPIRAARGRDAPCLAGLTSCATTRMQAGSGAFASSAGGPP